jgi:hypothetical protein
LVEETSIQPKHPSIQAIRKKHKIIHTSPHHKKTTKKKKNSASIASSGVVKEFAVADQFVHPPGKEKDNGGDDESHTTLPFKHGRMLITICAQNPA